jgi:hypothetical protein
MSYELVFWRQLTSDQRAPDEIYALIHERPSDTKLSVLPVEAFVARILQIFPAAVREPNGESEWIHCVGEDGAWSFQVEWFGQAVRVDMRGAWSNDTANALIDIGQEFGCPLYDPQTRERFKLYEP